MIENKQKVYVLTMLLMIVLLSISQNTEGNSNIPHAPVPEEGFLPNPFQCVNDARKVPDCIDAEAKIYIITGCKSFVKSMLSVNEEGK
ncbi:hypothetical protein YC2023_075410 [Brassica napus]